MARIIVLDAKISGRTLSRVREMLYGAYRSCDPSGALSYASDAIGRTITHGHVLAGDLTEREGLSILRRLQPLFPDLKDRIEGRITA